jgi:transposase-like protein
MNKKDIPTCPECGNNASVIKFGKPREKQRYYCNDEECRFSFTTKDVYVSSGGSKRDYSANDKIEACDKYREMNKEGISLRKAAKALGISHTSLARWEKNYEEIKEWAEYPEFKFSVLIEHKRTKK